MFKRIGAIALVLSFHAFAQSNLYILSTAYSGKSTLYKRGAHTGAALTEIAPTLNPPLSQDAVVRVSGGKLFVLERSLFPNADRIRVFDPQQLGAAPVSISLTVGANPQDIVYVPTLGKAFVTQYGKNQIAIVDPITGQISSEAVDLSPFVDPQDQDGVVEMHRLRKVGNTLYVTLQSQSNFVVSLAAKIVEIDLSQAPYSASAVTLPTVRNPTSSIQTATVGGAQQLIVGYSGKSDFGLPADAMDGFVAIHDLAGLASQETFATDGVTLGLGDVSDVAVRPQGSGFYAAISGSTQSSVWYVPFDGTVSTQVTPSVSAGYAHPEVAVDTVNRKLYVVRRDSASQGTVRILDTDSNAPWASWTIDAQRAPFSIALDESLTTPTRDVRAEALRLTIAPNPTPDGRGILVFSSVRAESCRVRVVDAMGRVILQSTHETVPGENRVALNLLAAPSGVVAVNLTCGDRSGTVRWVR